MRDDGPRPEPVKVQLHRMRLGPRFLQRINGPHSQIRDQQKRHNLASRLVSDLLGRRHGSLGCVEYEDGLKGRLDDTGASRDQH